MLDIKQILNVSEFKLTRESFDYEKKETDQLSDLLYFGSEGDLEYFIIFKTGTHPNYIITLAKPEHVLGLNPQRSLKNCHNLKEVTGVAGEITEVY